MKWSSHSEVAELLKLWNKGLSAGQIAWQLDRETRQAIIGKIGRIRIKYPGLITRPLDPSKRHNVKCCSKFPANVSPNNAQDVPDLVISTPRRRQQITKKK